MTLVKPGFEWTTGPARRSGFRATPSGRWGVSGTPDPGSRSRSQRGEGRRQGSREPHLTLQEESATVGIAAPVRMPVWRCREERTLVA